VSDLPIALALTGVAAAILAYAGIAGVIGWLKARALAKPNQRSSHTVPTPQGGGVMVVPAALVTAGIALAISGAELPGGALYLALVGAAALTLTVIGFIDDMRGLSVSSRLISQILAVALAVALIPADLRIMPPVPLPIERALMICGALWFVNLFNFMDGIDLISVVETVAVTLGIVLLAAFGAIPAGYGIVAVALLGAMVGFAPWNAPSAHLFLGDAGSIPIGFLLAVLLIHVAAAHALAAAVILPLYYLADATVTLIRRFLRGERVWEAHRQHFYQQATRNGFTVIETVGRIAVLDAVLIALAIGAALHGRASAALAGLIAAAAVGWMLRVFARGRR
jgi:UDP-N-acetylmuramyl pentapeptide phosphotransferase/UDP-N-acetylglucosamine-1-phosphate transferase